MKALFTLAVAVPAVLAGVMERAVCNNDNCARAISGTAPGLSRASARKSDCSSFQTVTDYGELALATITSGSTPVYIPKATAFGPVSGAIPDYASSACVPSASVFSRYQSACSCAGIARTTTTLPTVTETVIIPTVSPLPAAKQCNNPTIDKTVNYCSYNCPCLFTTDDRTSGYCILLYSRDGARCMHDSDCDAGLHCITIASYYPKGVCGTPAGYLGCINPVEPPSKRLMARSEAMSPRDVPSAGGVLASVRQLAAAAA